MGLNKFITKKGRVLLDLTGDTVTPETLGKGVTAHDRSGEPIVGTMEGGGGEQPQLFAPTIDIVNNSILTIEENGDNGVFTVEYDIYVDGEKKATLTKE